MSTGKEILDNAYLILSDSDKVRWPLAEMVAWLNEGIKQIVLIKPSASSMSIEIDMVEGTRQAVPQSGTPTPLRIIDFERNITTTGNNGSQGRIITPVSRDILDAENPRWHDKSYRRFKTEVRHGVFDEDNPLQFYVFPGNDGNGKIAAVVSHLPAPITVAGYESEDTGLAATYDPVLTDYVLARAFLKDDLTSNPSRSQYHSQLFGAALGLKIQVEGATSPNQRRGGS
ncbi:DUF6682 family protein [Hoeflea poritis]|uniref:Uncharacterized protein n=1 Tax=Hoeflea poritis TaxID=2993659 RepID=A0ABT4VPE7_9HYPH|nr:DUF6682 family protein [Hoeflea poritis]MDA4845947.1 hypothetical protein [Hoeflea poritis]